MEHPDLETLMAGVDHAPDDVLRHVAECRTCQDDLATIRRTRAAGDALRQDPDLSSLVSPPPEVWDAIQRELAEDDTVVPLRSRRAPRGAWAWVAAAVVGAVLGSAITWAATHQDDSARLSAATSELVPLGQHRTRGTISLTDTKPGAELSLDVSGIDDGPGFVEVWLLDAQTGGMVSLGVLDGDHGSWAVPAGLDLAAYDQVDVSREPYDGDPAHSQESLARGRVP
jgi:hypothetical protein